MRGPGRAWGMGARMALVLAGALLAANLAALVLLALDRERQGRAALLEREVARVAAFVPALETVPPLRRQIAARRASGPRAQVAVRPRPRLADAGNGPRSRAVADALAEALPGREVRAALVAAEEAGPARGPRGRQRLGAPGDPVPPEPRRIARGSEMLLISVELEGGQWLDVVLRGREGRAPLPLRPWGTLLALSLLFVLGGALLGVRQLTRPLGVLADAARAAGRGDRAARAPETGAREVREAAAAFNDMQARIARFDAERTRTLAAVGHDLRTPIAALRIRAETLEETVPDAAAEARAMQGTLHDMEVMADGLLAYARGQAEPEAPRRTALAPLLGRLAAERGAEAGPLAALHAQVRPVALTRAVGNLVDNALRYAGAARLSLRAEGDEAVIAVEDDGPGIPEARLTDMAEPFVRGDASRGAATGGAGLGLSIARSIAETHGGRLGISNRVGGGLQAEIRLPLA